MKDNKLTGVLFIIYLIALFWIIILKFNIPFSHMGSIRRMNLIPFSESLNLNGKLNFGEMIMNIVIFVPLGMYSGILFKRWNIGKKLSFFFLISLICEGVQFILGVGVFDITDIINNTLGGFIGLMIFKGIQAAFNNELRTRQFINIFALTGTSLMFLMLFLLKINRLWIFRM
jgi:glycopeptide antibiotics resistance protein